MSFKIFTRLVLLLSLISFFTDVASEMLYPVIPLYLSSLEYGAVFIGFIEGIAEFIAGLSKGYFGLLSDKIQRKAPFVKIGYSLSAIAKPSMVLISSGWWVLITRTLDRLGKGIRTSARDAMLSAEATPETKGRIFGFHRSMDTLGAAVGPLVALVFLYYFPSDYKWLFLLSLFPGLITIFLVFLVKDKHLSISAKNDVKVSFFSFLSYIKKSSSSYKWLLLGLLLFALINSSDMFLLLKVKELHFDDTFVIGLYIIYNLSYALFSYPAGILADKLGLQRIFIMGIFIFSLVYFLIAFVSSYIALIILFIIYGLYAASTEGIGKAWISNIVPQNEVASAIGSYTALQSVASLLSSSIAGIIWVSFNSASLFLFTALSSFIIAFYFLLVLSKKCKPA